MNNHNGIQTHDFEYYKSNALMHDMPQPLSLIVRLLQYTKGYNKVIAIHLCQYI